MINYDALASSYDEKYKSQMSMDENIAVHNLLCKYRVKEKDTLDVGCGTGFSLDMCPIQNYKGIDISKEMIEQARLKYPDKNFVLSDINSAHLGLHIYDCVLCLFSIPYIGTEAVNKIYSNLKTKGICICVYYNEPYRNSDSVYYGHEQEFNNEIKPKLNAVIAVFKSRFRVIEEHNLTLDGTYTVTVFRKR